MSQNKEQSQTEDREHRCWCKNELVRVRREHAFSNTWWMSTECQIHGFLCHPENNPKRFEMVAGDKQGPKPLLETEITPGEMKWPDPKKNLTPEY